MRLCGGWEGKGHCCRPAGKHTPPFSWAVQARGQWKAGQNDGNSIFNFPPFSLQIVSHLQVINLSGSFWLSFLAKSHVEAFMRQII